MDISNQASNQNKDDLFNELVEILQIKDETPSTVINQEIIPVEPEQKNIESMTLEELLKYKTPTGWGSVFEFCTKDITHISGILKYKEEKHGKWFPLKRELFNALDLVPPSKVKVIIIGQDPYHGMGNTGLPQAMGLSFSVRPGEKVPSSLLNILLEIGSTVPHASIQKYYGDLTNWARQGVLLLNTCLTVQRGEAKSHGDIWKSVVITILNEVGKYNPKPIVLLWGKDAERCSKYLPNKSIILKAPHPSGMNNGREQKFLGCQHFVKVNEILKANNEELIDWSVKQSTV